MGQQDPRISASLSFPWHLTPASSCSRGPRERKGTAGAVSRHTFVRLSPPIFLRALQLLTLDLGLINKRPRLVLELKVTVGVWEWLSACLGVSRRAVCVGGHLSPYQPADSSPTRKWCQSLGSCVVGRGALRRPGKAAEPQSSLKPWLVVSSAGHLSHTRSGELRRRRRRPGHQVMVSTHWPQLVNMPEYKEGAKHPVLERIQEGPEAAAPDLQMYF